MSEVSVKHVTVSDLNKFLRCSQDWFYSKSGVRGIPVSDDDMIFGRVVHEGIDSYYNQIDENYRLPDIENAARQAWSDKVFGEVPTLHKRAEEQLASFIKFESWRRSEWRQFKPTFSERSLGDGFFYGRVDAYWQTEQVCVDFKTGGNGMLTDDMIRQNAVYRTILGAGSYPCKKVLFAMLAHGVVKEAPAVPAAYLDAEVTKYRDGRITPNRGVWCQNCTFVIRCEFKDLNLWDFA